jgi:DNA-binding GntR family transcriptional regulator
VLNVNSLLDIRVAETAINGNENSLSLSERAYRALERMIVTMKLQPGETLTEGALIARIGLGRTPVREAIQRLAWEGLLNVRPRSGIQIAQLEPADFPKVLAARRGVEMLLAWGAASYASPEHDIQFRRVEKDMLAAVAKKDVDGFLDADKAFDIVLGHAAANPYASRVAGPLQTHSRRFWFRRQRPDSLRLAAQRHVALIEAIIARDGDRAEQAAAELIDHLER